MKIPTDLTNWKRISPSVWERTRKQKDKNCKKGFCFAHRIYYEVICEYCGESGLATKGQIARGEGRFCSYSCANLARDMKGANHPNWKGGRKIHSDGYIYLKRPDHPNADKQGYVGEHVFVMSEEINRPLRKGEIPHHKNEIRDDNRIENLRLMANTEHLTMHRRMKARAVNTPHS